MSHLLIYSDRNYVIWHLLCLHLNIQSTVSQVPMDFILFIAVSVSSLRLRKTDTGFISVFV